MTSGTRTQLMTVGELSRRTGVPVKALREYTDSGLIYTAGRSQANYRLFTTDALTCVHWIGRLRGLGLTLAEIRDLVRDCPQGNTELVGPRLARTTPPHPPPPGHTDRGTPADPQQDRRVRNQPPRGTGRPCECDRLGRRPTTLRRLRVNWFALTEIGRDR